jgi:hypothetical protein
MCCGSGFKLTQMHSSKVPHKQAGMQHSQDDADLLSCLVAYVPCSYAQRSAPSSADLGSSCC